MLLAGSFTDLRYSRDAEQEADARSQAILGKIGLSSQGMAPFFRHLAGKGEAKLSQDRAKPGRAAFSAEDWKAIKDVCAKDPRRRFVPTMLQKR